MSGSKQRRGDTTESVIDHVLKDIEPIVQKAISAALSVFRDEIAESISDLETKLESIRERTNTVELRLDNVETTVTSMKSTPHHDTDLKDVITELNAIKSDQRETALKANDNGQYSRRNNLRFKGLPVKPTDDCRTAVVDFVRKQMHINIDLSDVDVAHPVSSKNSTSVKSAELGGDNSSSTRPVLLVKFKYFYVLCAETNAY